MSTIKYFIIMLIFIIFHMIFYVEPMSTERNDNVPATVTDHPPNLVKILQGHGSEVFTCAWSPIDNTLVTG